MIKYFNNFKLSLKEKKIILSAYKKGDISCFFSPTIRKAEEEFSHFFGEGYALATTNCTSALFLAFKVLNIKNDEHVIMPSFTHPSTAYACKAAGVKMKFCDCVENCYNMNIDHLSRLVNEKTKAIIYVYLKGFKGNICEVKKFCDEHKIILIEDVAQGFGVKVNGRLAGTFGEIACFSFNDSKIIQLGEGGMCLFKSKAMEEKARIIIHEGEFSNTFNLSTTISNGTINDIIFKQFRYFEEGFNFRPFPPAFSILIERINKVEKYRKKRFKIASVYLANLDKGHFHDIKFDNDDLLINFPILAKNKEQVTQILINSYQSGIPVGKVSYPTLNNIEVFRKFCLNPDDSFFNSEKLYERLLFLPLSKNVNKKDAKKIVEHVNNAVDMSRKVNFLNKEEEIKNYDGLYLW